MTYNELQREVFVDDPENWYGEDTITVKMFVLLDEKTVRILFESTDDFSIYRDIDEWSVDANWNWAKKHLWDHIEDIVSCEYLYEHGYTPW